MKRWLKTVMRSGAGLLLLFSYLLLNTALAEKTITYFHTDALGSVVAASDETGSLLWRKGYSPYGEKLNDGEGKNNAIAYTGKPHDDVTGLTYMGARYYDPEIGRFMGMDPAGVQAANPMSFNRYAYANNNPYKYVDPDGEAAILLWFATPPGIAALEYTGSMLLGIMGGAAVYETAVKPMMNEDTDNDVQGGDEVEREYGSLEACVGCVNPLDDVEFEGKTKNSGLAGQGYTEKWSGVDSDGTIQSGFKNPKTGKWTGGHESSKNEKYW